MDVWVMTCTLYGKVRINRGERSFTAERGDILLWPPGVPHDYITEETADDWIHNWVSFGSQSRFAGLRTEEHTSELPSPNTLSYEAF